MPIKDSEQALQDYLQQLEDNECSTEEFLNGAEMMMRYAINVLFIHETIEGALNEMAQKLRIIRLGRTSMYQYLQSGTMKDLLRIVSWQKCRMVIGGLLMKIIILTQQTAGVILIYRRIKYDLSNLP